MRWPWLGMQVLHSGVQTLGNAQGPLGLPLLGRLPKKSAVICGPHRKVVQNGQTEKVLPPDRFHYPLVWGRARITMLAGMAELADAPDLGSGDHNRAGSNPATGTIHLNQRLMNGRGVNPG